MSVITAVSDGVRVCMACDSQATNSNGSKMILSSPKIHALADCLFAADGSMVTDHFFRHILSLGPIGEACSLDKVVNDVVDILRRHLKEHGLMRVVNGSPELPGNMLVARRSEFVLVDGGGSIIRPSSEWWAIGSGGPEARGAMHAYRAEHFGADGVARAGVEAAIALDDGCSGPVRHLWTAA